MSQSLYLFVTSERPDQYLNPILHCLLYKSVSKVVFLHIKGLGSTDTNASASENRGISAAVFRNVQILLDSLAKGQYRYFLGEKADEVVPLQNIYPQERLAVIQRIYKQCLDIEVSWVHRDVGHLDLRKELARIHREEPTAIFDVTAISKAFLGDILATSIIEGIQNLHTFELRVRPNFDEPWTMLIHDLQADNPEKRLYRYVNIVDTPIFRECSNSILVRTPPLKVSMAAATGLLLVTLTVYLFYGELSWFIQIAFITSAIASILSLYFNFFPPRR